MKVALCLSGQPRFVEHAFPNIYQTLIEPNNADVFVHSWYDDKLAGSNFVSYTVNGWDNSSDKSKCPEGVDQKILELYKPKAFLFEGQPENVDLKIALDEILNSHARHYSRDYFVNMIYSSWLSILKSNQVKEQYRLKNGINYDYVIRARFDSTVNAIIKCDNFDPDYLYTDNRGGLPPRMIEDWFAFGSNKIMNCYSAGFNFIEHFVEESNKIDKIFCGETIVYEMVKMCGIKHARIENLIHCPVRQNMI